MIVTLARLIYRVLSVLSMTYYDDCERPVLFACEIMHPSCLNQRVLCS